MSTRTPALVQDAGEAARCCLLYSGPDAAYGTGCHVWGSWAARRRGSRGSAPRGWCAAAGTRGKERGVCGETSTPSPAEKAGKAKPHTPHPARLEALRWAGRTSGFCGRSAGTPSPPHRSPGGPGPAAPTATPDSPWPDRACPAAPPARGPGSPSSLPLPSESRTRRPRPDGHCGRPGLPGGLLVAGQLSGREGGSQDEEEECGRSGRGAGAVGRGPGR